MKTANRARRNGGKKTVSVQSETIPQNAPGKIPADMVTLQPLFEDGTRSPDKFQIPRELFVHIREAAVPGNDNWADFIVSAISEKRNRVARDRQLDEAFAALCDMGGVQDEIHFFIQSVIGAMKTWNDMGQWAKPAMDRLEHGFLRLWNHLDSELSACNSKARAALQAAK